MRGHDEGRAIALEIANLLKSQDSVLASAAAQAFQTIIGHSEEILNEKSSSRIRVGNNKKTKLFSNLLLIFLCMRLLQILYRQRLFSQLLPVLLKQFNDTSPSHRPYYLMAISNMLKHIPKSVLLSELPVV